MTAPAELAIQRKLTTAFINTMPVSVQLRPRVKQQTPTGGFVWSQGVPRAAQIMRLIEPSTVNSVAPRPDNTADGQDRDIAFFLIGQWDAVIGQDDTFTLNGYQWKVIQLATDNGWEKRASVARYG